MIQLPDEVGKRHVYDSLPQISPGEMRRPENNLKSISGLCLAVWLWLIFLLNVPPVFEQPVGAGLVFDEKTELASGAVDDNADLEDKGEFPGFWPKSPLTIHTVSLNTVFRWIATPNRFFSPQRTRAPPQHLS